MSMTPSRRTVESMTLGGMALDNRALIVHCNLCRRRRTFLAADLAKVYGANQSPHALFSTCTKCGSAVRVWFGFPSAGEVVCRPVAHTGWKWRDSVYQPGSIKEQ